MSAQPSITATRSRSKTAAQTTPQAQNQTQNHAKLIGKPKEQDILCGKDKSCLLHPGSIRFRKVIESYRERYQKAASKHDKMELTKAVYEELSKTSRFLKYNNEERKGWEEVSKLAARDKIGHALRFANRVAQKKSSKNSSTIPTTPTVITSKLSVEQLDSSVTVIADANATTAGTVFTDTHTHTDITTTPKIVAIPSECTQTRSSDILHAHQADNIHPRQEESSILPSIQPESISMTTTTATTTAPAPATIAPNATVIRAPADRDVLDVALALAGVRDGTPQTSRPNPDSNVHLVALAPSLNIPRPDAGKTVTSLQIDRQLGVTTTLLQSLLDESNSISDNTDHPKYVHIMTDTFDHTMEAYLSSSVSAVEQLFLNNLQFSHEPHHNSVSIFSLLWSLQCSKTTTTLCFINCHFETAWELEKLLQGLSSLGIQDLRFQNCTGAFTKNLIVGFLMSSSLKSLSLVVQEMKEWMDGNTILEDSAMESTAFHLGSLTLSTRSIPITFLSKLEMLSSLTLCGTQCSMQAISGLLDMLSKPSCRITKLGLKDCVFRGACLPVLFCGFQAHSKITELYIRPVESQEELLLDSLIQYLPHLKSVKVLEIELKNVPMRAMQQLLIEQLQLNESLECFRVIHCCKNDWERLVDSHSILLNDIQETIERTMCQRHIARH